MRKEGEGKEVDAALAAQNRTADKKAAMDNGATARAFSRR